MGEERRRWLAGEKVWLRPSERSDIDRFVTWLNDPEVTENLSPRAPISRAFEEKWFERMLEDQGRKGYHFVICLLEDDRAIGTVGLFDIDHENGSAGFGILIGEKELWGRGYGTDALNVILDFAFGDLRLERIWLDVHAGNERAVRSYEKAGFAIEATQRRALYRHGTYRDVYGMAILRDEWERLDRPKIWELRAGSRERR